MRRIVGKILLDTERDDKLLEIPAGFEKVTIYSVTGSNSLGTRYAVVRWTSKDPTRDDMVKQGISWDYGSPDNTKKNWFRYGWEHAIERHASFYDHGIYFVKFRDDKALIDLLDFLRGERQYEAWNACGLPRE